MAQMFSYALFFWAMVAAAFLLRLPPLGIMLAGLLSALNPIAVHVGTHYWLDGPLLAFCVLLTGCFH